MGLGIKEPKRKNVTGTIVMLEGDDASTKAPTTHDSLSLKRSNTGIILHPQPHDNPNDPLNWPIWMRDLCLLVVGFQTFLGGGQSPMLASGMSLLSTEFNKPLSTVSYLVGGFMLALGFGSVFASPTAVLYGKRLVYLSGIALFMIGSIVAGASKNFPTIMIGRIITGFGASPTESLPSATIAEIYFAHERAYRIGIYTMLMLGGKNIVPLLSGLVFQFLDRHWLFWILAIMLGINLILTFLFVPETFWDRDPTPNKRSVEESEAAQTVKNYKPPEERPNAFALRRPTTDNVLDVESLSSSMLDVTQVIPEAPQNPIGLTENTGNLETGTNIKPKSYINRLSIYSGRHTTDSWWMVSLRPFFLYLYPSILFSSFIYCFAVVWLIMISEVIAEIFHGEAYGYSKLTIGLFYISPFIGGILGSLSTGLISDRLSRYLVTKNNGIYEPEFRLFMILPATFFMAFGLLGFGWSAENEDLWIGPVIFFGCLSFGSSIASTTAITYAVDSYKVFASEALVSLNFLKNLLGFAFSLFNTSYYGREGGRISFVTYGVIQIFISAFAIPLYFYGKRCRAWTDDKELLKFLYHVDNVSKAVAAPDSDNDSDSPDVTMKEEQEQERKAEDILDTHSHLSIDSHIQPNDIALNNNNDTQGKVA